MIYQVGDTRKRVWYDGGCFADFVVCLLALGCQSSFPLSIIIKTTLITFQTKVLVDDPALRADAPEGEGAEQGVGSAGGPPALTREPRVSLQSRAVL